MIEKSIKSFIKKELKHLNLKTDDENIKQIIKSWSFFVFFLSFKINDYQSKQIKSFLNINCKKIGIDKIVSDVESFQANKMHTINWDKYCKLINKKENIPIFKNIIINILSAFFWNQYTQPVLFFYEKDFDEQTYIDSTDKIMKYIEIMIAVESDIKKIFVKNYAEIIDITKHLKKELIP